MGAVVALHWLKWREARSPEAPNDSPIGLLLFSPVIAIDQKVTLWQEILFKGLSRVFPTRRVRMGDFGPDEERDLRVTRDEAYQEYIYTSPHHLSGYSLRFVRHLAQLIQGCGTFQLGKDLSVLVSYAGHDVFIQPSLIERFVHNLRVEDKTARFYPDSFHCLLHDLEAWLEERWPQKAETF
jgi:alpha-beta hydrolase superfamily lysophospholipase